MTVYPDDKTLSRSLRRHYLELECFEQFVQKFRKVGLSELVCHLFVLISVDCLHS
jgi:hypothetical protein